MSSTPQSWPVQLLDRGLRMAGRLPLPVLHAFGALLGRTLWLCRARARRVAERNLSRVLPQDDAATRRRLACATLVETGKAVAEIAKIWGGGPARALALVRDVRGLDLFDAALARGNGLIVAAPHLGCWELLNYWLANRTELAILYRAPRHPALEPLLLKARGSLPVEQVRADGSGVRVLYRRLAAGGVVGILPDQKPRAGTGVDAPFFGVPAKTMVLLPRLAARTGATVLFGFAERLPRGAGYRLHFRSAPAAIAGTDITAACLALNHGIEDCVRLAFTQYQWSYKRFADGARQQDAERLSASR